MGALATFVPVLDDLRSRGKPTGNAALLALEVIIDRGQRIAGAYTAYEAGRTDQVEVPFFEIETTVADIGAFIEAYYGDLDYPVELFSALRDAESGLLSLQALRRAFASQASATSGLQNALVVTGTAPLIAYRLRQNDTLDRMALRFLGSADRASEIVDLNNLVYPFLRTERPHLAGEFETPDFQPGTMEFATPGSVDREGVADGVRVTGEFIWLPSDAHVPAPQRVFSSLDVELFGRDLRLSDGLLQIGDDGEIETIEGKDNLVQALYQRVRIGKGELVLHPDYGVDTRLTLGVEGTRSNIVLGGLSAARSVAEDPRVTAIHGLQLMLEDTVNVIRMRAQVIGPGDREIALNDVLPESASPAGGFVG